jgi:DNA-binding NarL/FixJ family response regulator
MRDWTLPLCQDRTRLRGVRQTQPASVSAIEQLGVRVLLLGDRTVVEEIAALLRAGAAGFVALDAEPAELTAAIARAARGEVVLGPDLTRRLLFAGDAASRAPRLSDRERSVLRLAAEGRSNRQIAEALLVCQSTVKTHLARAHDKLGTRRRTAAVAEALRRGLLDDAPDPAG